MKAAERRKAIVNLLLSEQEALSGSALSERFGVSRQIIVQDIALMRAENYGIVSTNKGYLLRSAKTENTLPKRVFFVKHTDQQVLDEFQTILELGGRILDVAVEHELYGQIRVDLLIETDGNVSFENAVKMRAAGADIFVGGSSGIFVKGMTFEESIAKFRTCIE